MSSKVSKYIFIGGTGRSGTTLLTYLLSQHKDVMSFFETWFFYHPDSAIGYLRNRTSWDTFAKTFEDKLYSLLTKSAVYKTKEELFDTGVAHHDKYLAEKKVKLEEKLPFKAIKPYLQIHRDDMRSFVDFMFGLFDKPIVVEKTPQQIRHVDLIYGLIPDMKFIHIIREPKDVASSMMVQSWGPKDLDEFIERYVPLMRDSYNSQKGIPRENYMVIEMEDLVHRPEESIKRLIEFTGVDYDAEQLRGMIGVNNAHIGRYRRVFNKEERKKIDKACNKYYQKFIELV